jgi:DNA helicase-2/ATP-dependent DNA helicase PcrA
MDDGLNPEQRQAVNTLSGPLLVLAGAGSGKTRVVTFRVAALIRSGIAPNRILAVTFTNKAAAEMQERISHQLGKRLKQRPVVATFHAHCVQILRRHIRQLGYPQEFAIYDRGDQESLAREVLREIRVPGELLGPSDLLYHVSRWKCRSIDPSEAAAVAESDKEHVAASGYRRYQTALKHRGAVDFDDLLLCTEKLFREHPAVLNDEAGRFDHVLVDEYQDTNGSQYRIVKALAGTHRNLCVVGDDDQSIYAWRGAEVQHILRFARDWPDAKVVRLEENYRSTAAILEMANRLIAFNRQRHPKTLRAARRGGEQPRIEQYRDETEEAKQVIQDIARLLRHQTWEPRDFAILFRTNEQPRAFETELRKADLPYVLIGGTSFFDRREVRDVLAYLKLFAAPHDEISLRRIINTPPRGIGQKTVEQLTDAAVRAGRPLWDILHQADLLDPLTPAARDAVIQLRELIRRYASRKPPLVPACRELLAEIQYESEIQRLYQDPQERQTRWNAVEQVVSALGSYEQQHANPTWQGFVEETTLGGPDFDNDKDRQLRRNAIILMTLHSAKGLEFPHVYMVGMEEGLLPHKRSVNADDESIDEERRLCYVGVTRAQERLTLTMALTRMKWGKPRESLPSRFLFELIGQAERRNKGVRHR